MIKSSNESFEYRLYVNAKRISVHEAEIYTKQEYHLLWQVFNSYKIMLKIFGRILVLFWIAITVLECYITLEIDQMMQLLSSYMY